MAIAFLGAASSAGFSTTNTLSVSVGAGTSLMVVHVRTEPSGISAHPTFNGVTMTLVTAVSAGGGNYYLYYLVNPSVGTFNLVIGAGGQGCAFSIAEYSGTRTDSSVVRNFSSNGSGASVSLVNDVAGSWGILCAEDRSGTDPTASTNSLRRTAPGSGASMGLFDTNGTQPITTFTMSATTGASSPSALGMVIAPLVVVSVPVSYLAVGGGGGGGQGSSSVFGAGGGGGGGVLTGTFTAAIGSTAIVIGAGGARATSPTVKASPGSPTSISGLVTANGGGAGSSGENGSGAGGTGASGGGAGENSGVPQAGGAANQGGGTGGINTRAGGGPGAGGGGGGASGNGANGIAGGATPSAGGPGTASAITGASTPYGAGGTGGAYGGPAGGPGASGAANTGNGGGGSAGQSAAGVANGGDGGAGIVVLSYQTGLVFATGGNSVYQSGANTVHVFTGSGTFQIVSIGSAGFAVQAGLGFGAQANLGVGGISFAAQPGMLVSTQVDLSPGYRPPAFLLPAGYETLEDNAGTSVPGGLVWSYQAGTTTPLPTYTDSTLTIANSNPIICDGAGRWSAWVPIGTAYKLVFETPAIPPAHGALIHTVDGLQILTLPTWAGSPYNVANFTAVGGGTWTVEPGDLAAYQFMLDGKRLFLSLHLSSTSIAGTVNLMKVALPPGIVSAGWQQSIPIVMNDNGNATIGAVYVNANSAALLIGRSDGNALAASTNLTTWWFTGVIAIT